MKGWMSSVRLRLATGAVTTLTIVLVLSWFGLVALFERHVERRIGAELDLYLGQLASETQVSQSGELRLGREPVDPRFRRVRGGLYWQIQDVATGALLRSRSLWDERLRLPSEGPAVGEIGTLDIAGPGGALLRVRERHLALPTEDGERVVRFVVAVDRADIDALTSDFASDLVIALVMLGVILALASLVQIAMGTAPLMGIGRQVAAVRAGLSRRLPLAPAREVRPLVDEVNALLDGADAQVARARQRAGDLAHGLKTPLVALKADAARLMTQGQSEIAAGIHAAVDAMSAQVERELARARIRHDARGARTLLLPVIERVADVLRRTPACDDVTINVDVPATVRVAIDDSDLAELMGNLLDNAVRHARTEVRVSISTPVDGAAVLRVEDDGPGLEEAQRAAVMRRGVRLDTSSGGAGLGLSIVSDIVEAYGAVLELSAAAGGGLAVLIQIGARSDEPGDGTA
jgi:signal transduction histidine kinase